MEPEQLKDLLFEFLKCHIEDLFILDRVTDTEIDQWEMKNLIDNQHLTLEQLVNKFHELARPYFVDYQSKMINVKQ